MSIHTIPTPDSSNVKLFGYDTEKSILFVEFKNGDKGEYEKVPPVIFADAQKAQSIGSFLHNRVKGYYDYRKTS